MSKTTQTKKVKVYMALVVHRHGENLYAGATAAALCDKLHGYVTQYWSEFKKTQPMPTSAKAAISQYFDTAKEFGAQGEFLTYSDDTIEVSV